MKKGRINQEQVRKGIYILPNLFTTASLFCAFYSLIASMRGDYVNSAIAIMLSGLLDGLDGKIARFTNTTSRFGVEYDSLSDLVAFGIAPAILAYRWSLLPFGRCGWIVAFLFAVCGALRLARFNVQVEVVDKRFFNGLPIPAAAAVIATSILFWDYLGGTGEFNNISILFAMVVLSFLMVSNIRYYSFKDLDFFANKPFMTLVTLVFIFVIFVLEPQIMFFIFASVYGLSGPAWFFAAVLRRRADQTDGGGDSLEKGQKSA